MFPTAQDVKLISLAIQEVFSVEGITVVCLVTIVTDNNISFSLKNKNVFG
jgi:hypothetical protein